MLCEFKDLNKMEEWVDMYSLAFQDPIPILKYAKHNHTILQEPFKTLARLCISTSEKDSDFTRAYKIRKGCFGKKFKFGVQVPIGLKQALELDKKN